MFYKTLPVNVAIIRGTTADTDGKISIEKEALTLEILNVAMAARNSCGYHYRAGRTDNPERHAGTPSDQGSAHWSTLLSRQSRKTLADIRRGLQSAFSGQIKVPIGVDSAARTE